MQKILKPLASYDQTPIDQKSLRNKSICPRVCQLVMTFGLTR